MIGNTASQLTTMKDEIAALRRQLDQLSNALDFWEHSAKEADRMLEILSEELAEARRLLKLTGWEPEMSVSALVEWEQRHNG